MTKRSLRHSKMLWLAAVAAGAIAALTLALILASHPSGATASAEPNPAFSVLQPTSEKATTTLPENAQRWLAETEATGLSGLKDEPLVSLGATETPEGEVVVVELGQDICAYSVRGRMSTCGDMNLIAEGKLLVVVPGCPTNTILGVLPDGFNSVQVEVDQGKADEIAVSSNVYTAQIQPGETVLSATGPDGQAVKVGLPLGEMGQACKS